MDDLYTIPIDRIYSMVGSTDFSGLWPVSAPFSKQICPTNYCKIPRVFICDIPLS